MRWLLAPLTRWLMRRTGILPMRPLIELDLSQAGDPFLKPMPEATTIGHEVAFESGPAGFRSRRRIEENWWYQRQTYVTVEAGENQIAVQQDSRASGTPINEPADEVCVLKLSAAEALVLSDRLKDAAEALTMGRAWPCPSVEDIA